MDTSSNNNLNKEHGIDEVHLLDYLIVLAKRKKLIIAVTLLAAVLTVLYSFIVTPVYKAETKILLPRSGRASEVATQLLSQNGVNIISSGSADSPSVYIELIRSRPVYDRIIERFDLMRIWEAKTKESARKKLDRSVEVELIKPKAKEGLLQESRVMTVSVSYRDPAVAADMANTFIDELQHFMKNIALTEASQKRLFLEKQIAETREALVKSEEAMKEFQEKTGALQVEHQAKAVIESIAGMRAQIAAKEVELSVIKTYSTPNNPDLQRVTETIKALRTELAKLEQKGGTNPDPIIPSGRIASVGTDYARKLRELKFNEAVYELLAKQYEMAKIEEAQEPALIQVLEKAVPPEEKSEPKILRMTALALFAGLFFSLFLAFFMEYLERQSGEGESGEKMQMLKRYLSFK
jgi:uncharacterized protein involved in exopolysaccharide biosynthesis